MYGGLELQLHPFIISAVDKGRQLYFPVTLPLAKELTIYVGY